MVDYPKDENGNLMNGEVLKRRGCKVELTFKTCHIGLSSITGDWVSSTRDPFCTLK